MAKEITPALNSEIVDRALAKCNRPGHAATEAEFDKAYDEEIIAAGYLPEDFKAVMEIIGSKYENELDEFYCARVIRTFGEDPLPLQEDCFEH